MKSQPIEYMLPTSRSFTGMKQVLFRPFNIGKWLVLGFTAWLAGLLDRSGGGSNGGDSGGGGGKTTVEFFRKAAEWAQENLELVIGIGSALLLIVLAVFIVLLWIGSRGKFMFLDNVVHNRAQVARPWRQFRAQGNSLFCWRLVFASMALIVLFLIGAVIAGFVYLQVEAGPWTGGATLVTILLGVMLFVAIVALSYIGTLLEDFVIPLMYRDTLTANGAWRRFLAIHRISPSRFVLYFLWKFLLGTAAFLCIIALGCVTCCIGFIVMVIPYLGAVLLLPVSVFFRFLGPEFLRQFGSDYDVFASAMDATEET